MTREKEPQKVEAPKDYITMRGVLEFYSETGTEGGYWAFQDEKFISKVPAEFGVWGEQTVFDLNDPNRRGKTKNKAEVLHGDKWDPLPDPIEKERDYYASSLFRGEQNGNKNADKRLMEKYGFKIKYAAERMDEAYGEGNWRMEDEGTAIDPDGNRVFFGGTPDSDRPYGTGKGDITRTTVKWDDGIVEQRLSDSLLVENWSYDGLHVLQDGDELTVYSRENPEEIVWEGTISLSPFTVFKEDAFGLWIHNDQMGIDRKTWATYFFKANPAKLKKPVKDQAPTQK